MADTLEQRLFDRGYAETKAALESGQLALVDALHGVAIAPEDTCYNRGANQATEDYIKEQEHTHTPISRRRA